jgi:hypothetical protein
LYYGCFALREIPAIVSHFFPLRYFLLFLLCCSLKDYLNLYSNQMTGTVPENLRLRRLFHLDLGRNQFRGQLPADFADKAGSLRLFHIDHNEFTGEIPALYSQTGNGRVVSYAIDNNQFTGVPPVEDLQFGNVLGTNEQ